MVALDRQIMANIGWFRRLISHSLRRNIITAQQTIHSEIIQMLFGVKLIASLCCTYASLKLIISGLDTDDLQAIIPQVTYNNDKIIETDQFSCQKLHSKLMYIVFDAIMSMVSDEGDRVT